MAQFPFIFRVATCELLGTSDATNGRTPKCKTCRHRSLFFLVPVGTKDDAATPPNRIGRRKASSWRHCHSMFCGGTTRELLAHQTPPMAAPQNVRHADTVACSSLSLLVPKVMLQHFQRGWAAAKPVHDAIAIQLFAAPLFMGSCPHSWAHRTPPMAAPQNVRHADTVACSFLSL